MDRLTPDRRRWLMSRVRNKNTGPELLVRRVVFGLGYRYRLHASGLPGHPDIVFPSKKKVIFVHGCFWHRHTGCRLASMPATRVDFWRPKLSANRRRDRQAVAKLRLMGWDVLVIWGCELGHKRSDLVARLQGFLRVKS